MSKITLIETQKNNTKRVNIYIDGQYSFSCDLETALKHSLKTEIDVQVQELKDILEEDNYLKCKNSALKIVERSTKSEKEIIDKLKIKGYDQKTINRTIDFLKEYGFIDDEKYVRNYIKRKSKSEGEARIKAFLYNKGIPEKMVDEGLCLMDKEMEEKTAFNLALKRYKIILSNEHDNKKIYKKIGDYLLRKGYSYDICKRVLRNLLTEEDDCYE